MVYNKIKRIVSLLPVFVILACFNEESSTQAENDYFEIEDFSPADTLTKQTSYSTELGETFGFVNQKGDTIIPFGRFTHSFSDTIVTFGIVIEKNAEKQDLIGINQKGQRLYEIHWFDNGPDYPEEGLFRIKRNGKTGFADLTGKIIIAPQYDCAYPFSAGRAKVSYDCELEKDPDHTEMKSDSWFYIDRDGKRVE